MRKLGKITAFYDVAGHPQGENALIVCGHVSAARKWEKFEKEWRQALADAGISGPFHMTEFMACEKSFEGWKPRIDDRVNLILKLISIIKRNVYKGFSEAVLLQDWRAANQIYQLEESRCTPFGLGGFFVMDKTIRWWGDQHGREEMTDFIFEDGDKNKGDFIWMMEQIIVQRGKELRIVRPKFAPKGLPMLQAADLTGWTMGRSYRAWLNNEVQRSIPLAVREALVKIGNNPHRGAYLDHEQIVKFCKNFGVPRRGESRKWEGVGSQRDGQSAEP